MAGSLILAGLVLLAPAVAAGPTASVERDLPDSATGGKAVKVTLQITKGTTGPLSLAIDEGFPSGWTIASAPSEANTQQAGRIKWFFLDVQVDSVSYEVKPPRSASGEATFAGTFRDSKMNASEDDPAIGGAATLSVKPARGLPGPGAALAAFAAVGAALALHSGFQKQGRSREGGSKKREDHEQDNHG